jgi:hypothetical protein
MRIKRTSHGTTHRIAQCYNCDWNDSYKGGADLVERVAKAAKAHAQATGHSVVVESGASFIYTAGEG